MSDYGMLSRVLHRLVLGCQPVAETCFAVDRAIIRSKPEVNARHVYVAGLARAGTTVLMRRIFNSGCFRSITYADMPFVLAPNIWQMLRRNGAQGGRMSERAHGDGVFVCTNSPESFEEVFWRIFDAASYLRKDKLSAHNPDGEIIDRYQKFVAGFLHGDTPKRYLCKNNNNIIRLPVIKRAFPSAEILIPFRNPFDQARSLFQQHRLFKDLQRADPFTLKYMTLLGHHEFGLDHRPFAVSQPSQFEQDTLTYWVDQWVKVYGWLLETAPKDAVWVCYENLCDDPGYWLEIADQLNIPDEAVPLEFKQRHREEPDASEVTPELADQALSMYENLKQMSGRGYLTENLATACSNNASA